MTSHEYDKDLIAEAKFKNDIGRHLQELDDLTLPPMIGGYAVFVEVVDAETGEPAFVMLRSSELSVWIEYGVLGLRIKELEWNWLAERFGGNHE